MTDEQHNKYLAYSFFAYSGFQVFWLMLISVWMYLFFTFMPTRPGQPDLPIEFFGLFFAIMALVQIIFTLPSVIAGYGLLKQKSWGRIAGIIGGVTASMSVPIGTAVCVYAMWFLLSDKGKGFYEAVKEDLPATRLGLRESTFRPWEEQAATAEHMKEPRPSDWR
jgi:hypothetical protein